MINELLREYVDSRGLSVRVDREKGVLRGVKLLGLRSRNGRRYLANALALAADLYEDVKVNINHPKGDPLSARDYQDRLGMIRNVQVRSDEGLFGDLHFNPRHPVAEQLLWDAEHSPGNVGLSHNVEARTRRDGDEVVVEAILKVQSVDLVADPATTRGLFEQQAFDVSSPAACQDDVPQETEPAADQEQTASLAESRERELALLRAEVDSLRAREAVRRKQEMIRQVLAEHGLPAMEPSSGRQTEIISELFWQSLMTAEDETMIRQLIEDRSRLVAEARRLALTDAPSPQSRDQTRVFSALDDEMDAAAFARAIL